MTKLRPTARLLVLAALTIFTASAASAQATRTWVSGTGDDAELCSRTEPCKTFAGAILKTAPGGEINVLDPGGFGSVVITKSMTIDGLGITGGILVSGSHGFIINASATSKIILRNLMIDGSTATGSSADCPSCHGIRFIAGGELTVQNLTIQNIKGNAIEINQTQTSVTNIRNLTTENVAGVAVRAVTTSGQAVVIIDDSHLRATTEGVLASGNARISVRDSVVSKVTTGIRTTGANSIINVENAFVSFCATGLQASAGSTINVSNSFIAQNATGVSANGGTLNSYGGNSLVNNTAPGVFNNTFNKQ